MKNFFDCKDEKITEKAFSQSLLISVLSILLCIVALCSITYAWFTGSTSSGNNTLVSGSFNVDITVTLVGDGTTRNIDAVSDNEGKYTYTLQPGTYEISFMLTETSTVKGHCVVTIGNNAAQHTAAIIGTNTANVENEEITDPFKFKITLTEAMTVVLEPRWGVVVNADIDYNEEIKVGTVPSGEESNEGTE
ncbi:MAG: hypothetical protein J6B48_03410 [Clostridia bacterium]|nr:hypothetical protein [Clostridia bacterium]